jgi:Tripartite tricarboxylate transporter family receptor
MNTRVFLALVALTAAQLPAQLAAITGNRGVSMGHLHLVVRDVDAQKNFWTALGGTPVKSGTLELIEFPGVYVMLRQGEPTAGTVRPLGVTTALRSPVLPNVPTIAESGLPGFDTGVWWGLLGPAGLPGNVKLKLAKDCIDAVNTPTVKARLLALGATPIGSSPEDFAALIRADYEKWGPIIKAAGIRGE